MAENCNIANLPFEDVSQAEQAELLYMREEEKLARDLYLSFYEKWGVKIFENIARSEQRHTDAIKGLLDKYSIADPIVNDELGLFANANLQQIYNDLLNAGNTSLIDALKVGAAVEELDIADLVTAIEASDNQDIKAVYENLMKGSRNHLRSYVRLLEAYTQEDYQAVYLTAEEADAIINSPIERGGYGKGVAPNGQNNDGTCTLLSSDATDNLNLNIAGRGNGRGDGTGTGGGRKGNGDGTGTCRA
ncbi:MAG: DUF2202 domain-containing protein [Desulfamplus sp.]|nr:DUF2202 domain-containing protein [Desulfamplus sp.]